MKEKLLTEYQENDEYIKTNIYIMIVYWSGRVLRKALNVLKTRKSKNIYFSIIIY